MKDGVNEPVALAGVMVVGGWVEDRAGGGDAITLICLIQIANG